MWKPLALAVLTSLPCIAAATDKPEVAWLVGPTEAPTGFAEVWRTRSGGLVWRLASPSNQTLVELAEPALPAGSLFSYGECTDGEGERRDLIVEIKVEDTQGRFATARKAWRLDPACRIVALASVQGLTCYNPDYRL